MLVILVVLGYLIIGYCFSLLVRILDSYYEYSGDDIFMTIMFWPFWILLALVSLIDSGISWVFGPMDQAIINNMRKHFRK